MNPSRAVALPPLGRRGPFPGRTYAALARARPRLAAASLAGLAGCGVAIAAGGANRHSAIVQGGGSGLPSWIAGPFEPLRVQLGHAEFVLVLGAMGIAYVVALALSTEVRARWVLGTIVVMHVAFLLAPPLLSTDVFNYIDYARLGALHGLDPYAHGAAAAPHDPTFPFTAWRHTGSAYGPLFTIGSYPLAHIGVAGALWGFKLVAAAASLGCVALVWRIAEQLGREPVRAVAIFGLNPMLLVWTVGGAHNDLLMLLLVLAGILLALRAREFLGGSAVLAAVAIKATAGVAIPFVLLGARRRLPFVVGLAACAAVVGGAAMLAFPGHPLGVFEVLGKQQHTLVAYESVPAEVASLLGIGSVTPAVRVVAGAALIATLACLVWRTRRGADWVAGCGWALAAVVSLSSWLVGWYAVWPLAFAALARDRRLLVVTLAIQAYFVVNRIPLFTMMPPS